MCALHRVGNTSHLDRLSNARSLQRQNDQPLTVTGIHRTYIGGRKEAVCLRTFRRWVEKGSKLAAVAWGGEEAHSHYAGSIFTTPFFPDSTYRCIGSVYLLLLIGAAELKTRLLDATGQFAWQVASVLRDPNPGVFILSCNAYAERLFICGKKPQWAPPSLRGLFQQ